MAGIWKARTPAANLSKSSRTHILLSFLSSNACLAFLLCECHNTHVPVQRTLSGAYVNAGEGALVVCMQRLVQRMELGLEEVDVSPASNRSRLRAEVTSTFCLLHCVVQ
jgi:hypothetical protein